MGIIHIITLLKYLDHTREIKEKLDKRKLIVVPIVIGTLEPGPRRVPKLD